MGYSDILAKIPESVALVVVSKTQTAGKIKHIYDQGQRIFGENKVQELCQKQQELPQDIQWHCIGHLQSNKVKYIAPFVAMIHSVDSLKLLQEINKQAQKNNRIIDCLLQFHVAQEDTKFGLNKQEASDLVQDPSFKAMQHVRIRGIMGMASLTENQKQIESEFGQLRHLFEEFKTTFFIQNTFFDTLSMGMSSDYELAIQSGSTMVRIGSAIFN